MKAKLRILNFFYFAISAVALFVFVVTPFLKTTIKYEISADVLEDSVDESLFDEFGINNEDLFNYEEELSVEIPISLSHKMLLECWQNNNAKRFCNKNLLEPVAEKIMDNYEDVLIEFANSAVEAMINNVFRDKLETYVPVGKTLGQRLEEVSEFSVTDFETSVVNCAARALQPQASDTFSTICEFLTDEYNKYANVLGGDLMTGLDMRLAVDDYFTNFELVDKKTGQVNDVYHAIGAILKRIAKSKTEYNDEYFDEEYDDYDSPIKASKLMKFSEDYEDMYDEPLEAVLMEVIDVYIGSTGRNLFFWGARLCSLLLVIFMATWFIKVFQCFICLFRKKPYVRVDFLGIISCLAQIILALVTVVFAFLYIKIGSLQNIALFQKILAFLPTGLVFKLEFSTLIPSLLVIVNFLYSIVYGAVKRKFKHDYRKQELEDTYEY